jgi:hypothetical protein
MLGTFGGGRKGFFLGHRPAATAAGADAGGADLVDDGAEFFEEVAAPGAGFDDEFVKVVDLLAESVFGGKELSEAGVGASALGADRQQVAAVDVGNMGVRHGAPSELER